MSKSTKLVACWVLRIFSLVDREASFVGLQDILGMFSMPQSSDRVSE